jgi:hypothetical protein
VERLKIKEMSYDVSDAESGGEMERQRWRDTETDTDTER